MGKRTNPFKRNPSAVADGRALGWLGAGAGPTRPGDVVSGRKGLLQGGSRIFPCLCHRLASTSKPDHLQLVERPQALGLTGGDVAEGPSAPGSSCSGPPQVSTSVSGISLSSPFLLQSPWVRPSPLLSWLRMTAGTSCPHLRPFSLIHPPQHWQGDASERPNRPQFNTLQ